MIKKLFSLSLVSLICLLFGGVSVYADTFKDGDITYVLEEREFDCGAGENIFVEGLDKNGNLIVEDYENEVIYKVDSDNKCTKMTNQEILEYINDKKYEYFDIYDYSETEEPEYWITKIIDSYYYNSGYIKTKDTELKEKDYYILNEYSIELVQEENLNEEDLDTYYEEVYFKLPESAKLDEKVTYYEYFENSIYNEVTDPKEEDILDYLVLTEYEEVTSEEKLVKLDSKVLGQLYEKHDGIVHVVKLNGEDVYYLVGSLYSEEYEHLGYNVYDLEGNPIEKLQGIDNITTYSNSLIGVIDEEKSMIYNSDLELLYETDEFVYLEERGYEDYYYLMISWKFTENSEILNAHNMFEYKLLEGANQTFGKDDLTFKFSGKLDKLIKVSVDDIELKEEDYTKESGSTIITLKKDYLKTLKGGEHTLIVEYDDGVKLSVDFETEELPPKTGDGIINNFIIGLFSLLGLSFLVVNLKKQSKN